MKVMVTGATGFIGRHLVSNLSAQHEIYALVRGQCRADLGENVSLVGADLTRALDGHTLPANIDVIVPSCPGKCTLS